MSIPVPPLLTGLIDDAAVFPPGSAPLDQAIEAHRGHRAAWYSPLVGPLLIPAIDVNALAALAGRAPLPEVGLVGELPAILRALDALPDGIAVRQIECPVAKRGEDPLPGLAALIGAPFAEGAAAEGAAAEGTRVAPVPVYAETPLTWGLMGALDRLAEARAGGVGIAPKFRTGGVAAELFPTPVELAAVICACRDRGLPFKLTAGLHHAVRQHDLETGLVHHGFLNVLVAALAAADGAEPVDLAEILGGIDPVPLADRACASLNVERPLWIGFGSCSVADPLRDLTVLGLLPEAPA